MTASRIVKLECDYPLCSSVFERRREDVAAVRIDAAKGSWLFLEGELDFCGHHPELKKHKPTLTELSESIVGTAYFATSCNCGWEYERKPSAWDKEGGTLRDIALRCWARHLPYEKPELCRRRTNAAAKKARDASYQQWLDQQAAAAATAEEAQEPPAS